MVSYSVGLVDSKRVKRLYEQVAENRKSCRYEVIEALLVAVGFSVRKAKGSNRIFTRPGSFAIVVPERRPVKEHYVDRVLEAVDGLR